MGAYTAEGGTRQAGRATDAVVYGVYRPDSVCLSAASVTRLGR